MELLTYEHLLESFCLEKNIDPKGQIIKNIKSALSKWCSQLKCDLSSKINSDFEYSYVDNLKKYRDTLSFKLRQSTVTPIIANINSLRKFYITTKKSDKNQSFPQKFIAALQKNELNPSALSRLLQGAVSSVTIRRWTRTNIPKLNDLPTIKEIEKLLGLEIGELVSSIPPTLLYSRCISPNLRPASKKFNFPVNSLSVFADELDDLTDFKSSPLVRRGMRREGMWTADTNSILGSRMIFEKAFRAYANFLVSYGYIAFTGKSFSSRNATHSLITIGLLADEDLLHEYITHACGQCHGKFHHGHLRFLSSVSSLLRPRTGYLWQQTYFAEKIGLNLSTKQWQKKCEKTRNYALEVASEIKQAKKSGSMSFAFGRDPEERIKWILELPDPTKPITDMIKKMIADLPKFDFDQEQKAIHFQRIVLIAIIQNNPFRVSMFSKMRFHENLIKKTDDTWWIAFKREDFKNRMHLKGDYFVKLSSEIYPLLDIYVRDYYPSLRGRSETNLVFVKQFDEKESSEESCLRYSGRAISDILLLLSRCYIPDCVGFRCHAYRHIIATALVKKNPNLIGLGHAAAALNDSIETVKERYEHLTTNDYFAPVSNSLSDSYKKSGLSDIVQDLLNHSNGGLNE